MRLQRRNDQPNILRVSGHHGQHAHRQGTMVTITPRSVTAGILQTLSEVLFSNVCPMRGISHQDATRSAPTPLQENVSARRVSTPPERNARVAISTSAGVRDLQESATREVPLRSVVISKSRDLTVNIPTTKVEDEFVARAILATHVQSLRLKVSERLSRSGRRDFRDPGSMKRSALWMNTSSR